MESTVRQQQTKQKGYHDQHCHLRELEVGQSVWARNLQQGPRWRQGVICDKLGPRSYLVELEGGELWRRHIDQLHTGTAPPAQMTGARESELNQDWDTPGTITFPAEEMVAETSRTNQEATAEETGVSSTSSAAPGFSEAPDSPVTPVEQTTRTESIGSSTTPNEHQSSRYPTRMRHKPNRLYGQMTV